MQINEYSLSRCMLKWSHRRSFSIWRLTNSKWNLHSGENLLSKIRIAKSLKELEEISRCTFKSLNDVHVSSILHRLASGPEHGGLAEKEDLRVQSLVDLLISRFKHLLINGQVWNTAFGNAFWALGRLDIREEDLWRRLLHRVYENLPHWKSNTLVLIYSTLPVIPPTLVPYWLYREVGDQVGHSLPRIHNAKKLVMILKASEKRLAGRVLRELEQRDWSTLDDHNIGTILSSIATLCDPGGRFLIRMAREVDIRSEDCGNGDVTRRWVANAS